MTGSSPSHTLLALAACLRRLGFEGDGKRATGADSIHSGPIRSFTKKGPVPGGWGREVETSVHARRHMEGR